MSGKRDVSTITSYTKALVSVSYLLIFRSGKKSIGQTSVLGQTAIIADVVLAILALRKFPWDSESFKDID